MTCAGELDLHAAPELRFLLCQMMQLGTRDLVVDLTATTLSPDTVRTHLRNAMKKLGARSRPHAIALAIRHREIDP